MKSGRKIYERLVAGGKLPSTIRRLSDGNLRSLLRHVEKHELVNITNETARMTPAGDIYGLAVVTAAGRWLKQKNKKGLLF